MYDQTFVELKKSSLLALAREELEEAKKYSKRDSISMLRTSMTNLITAMESLVALCELTINGHEDRGV